MTNCITNILGSASKIVLLAFAGAMIGGLFTNHISEDKFMICAVMVFTYYFTKLKTSS